MPAVCRQRKNGSGCLISSSELFRQILCGGGLADKLAGAESSFDQIEWGGGTFRASDVPELPGRHFVTGSGAGAESGGEFPKKKVLVQDSEEGLRERGRLLHYFANHELLAIETMALTLLRFPEAPLDFRRGVFKTLQDEQRHMRLYLERMKEYGVALGDAPLSFYFWNRLRDMKTPLDFVVRMSMTFEQANLDFALEFSELFEREMDDQKTARLLREVHDDEVKHVGHGVKWFKEWNGEAVAREGEWGAYLKELPYPLNARRAKGSVFFSAESRRAAGFSEEYIQSVRIAGGSRGRVPDYYLFNPECEIESGIQDLPKPLREKIEDLAPVMLWLAHGEDVVELPRRPSLEFQREIFEYRGELPEIVTEEEVKNGLSRQYEVIESLKPWGWGRRAWAHLTEWKDQVRKRPSFDAGVMSEFHSKAYWKKILLERGAGIEGEVISSVAEFRSWLDARANSSARFIFKAAHSTSGRGHVVFQPSVMDAEVTRLLARQSLSGVIEPFHEKVADFSIQYEIFADKKIKRFEPRFFFVDDHLQYLGAWLGPIPGTHELFPVWQEIQRARAAISRVHDLVLNALIEAGYAGPVGIDALVVRDGGGLRVVPVIEVNARYTMGRVAHALESVLRKKGIATPAMMKFHSKQELKRLGLGSFGELAAGLSVGSFFPVTPADAAVSSWVSVHFTSPAR